MTQCRLPYSVLLLLHINLSTNKNEESSTFYNSKTNAYYKSDYIMRIMISVKQSFIHFPKLKMNGYFDCKSYSQFTSSYHCASCDLRWITNGPDPHEVERCFRCQRRCFPTIQSKNSRG